MTTPLSHPTPDAGRILTSSRADWLAARRKLITGTDAARILGLSSFGGPMNVYLEKLGLDHERTVTDAMRAGTYFERPIIQWYADQEQVPITFEQPYTITMSPTSPIIGATLDARRTDLEPNPPVDAKNIRWSDSEKWGEPGTDQIPVYYATQLILQMHVTGAPYADLAVVFSGQDLCVYRLYRDPALEAEVIGRCEAFWENHVLREIPPAVDGSPAYTKYLQEYVKQTSEAIIAATPEHHMLAQELNDVQRKLEALEASEELCKNHLKEAIGEGKTIVGSCWKANWTQAKDSQKTDWRGAFDNLVARLEVLGGVDTITSQGFKLMIQEAVSAHTATTPGSRRFTFNWKG